MSRWIVALMVVAVSARAERVVISGPELTFTCPTAKSLDVLRGCVEQHGWTYKLLRTLGRARLIEVNAPTDPLSIIQNKTPSLAIYVPNAQGWQLGGLVEPEGAYELLDAQQLTIGHTNGFRLDVGETIRQSMVLVDGVAVDGIEHVEHVVFCAGDNYNCSDVISSCEWVGDGHVVSTFHGDVKLVDRRVRIEGDSSRAAPNCAGATEIALGWQ